MKLLNQRNELIWSSDLLWCIHKVDIIPTKWQKLGSILFYFILINEKNKVRYPEYCLTLSGKQV